MWQLYQKRWRSWVEELDVRAEIKEEMIEQGFQGLIGSVDGTYCTIPLCDVSLSRGVMVFAMRFLWRSCLCRYA